MKLTLKQLYGYSYMNWLEFRKGLQKLINKRECSFCIDSNWKCDNCRIDRSICDGDYREDTDNIYDDVDNATAILFDYLDDMIRALEEEYKELDK